MRSLRVKILVWCFAILVFSLIALFGFAPFLAPPQAGPGDLIRATNELQAEGAERAYEEGGQPGLRSYLEKLKRQLAGEYSLFDREGIDLLTGESRTHFLQIARSRGGRLTWVGNDGFVVVAAPSAQRWFAAQHTPPFRPSDQVPYFLMILFAMGVFCWILAVNIAGPLQNMAQVVTRFGAGDLDARIEVRRADEIGKLAESFNQMAGRIQQFLQAEKRLLQDISSSVTIRGLGLPRKSSGKPKGWERSSETWWQSQRRKAIRA
jgi:methyl-accepting chemotaxis protein